MSILLNKNSTKKETALIRQSFARNQFISLAQAFRSEPQCSR